MHTAKEDFELKRLLYALWENIMQVKMA